MEEKKDYRQQPLQKFYFNDDGKLVVESNKGVWVDGEKYVRMKGIFTCNAKTLGTLISHLKDIRVVVGVEHTYVDRRYLYDIRRECDIIEENTYCILGVENDVIDDVLNKKARDIAETEFAKKMSEYEHRISEENDKNNKLERIITTFNAIPWYKRVFKKIEIK